MVPGYDNLVRVWQGAQPFVELSNLMKLPKIFVRLVALRTDFQIDKEFFFTSCAAARSYRGVGSSPSSSDFCFLAMVSSFSLL